MVDENGGASVHRIKAPVGSLLILHGGGWQCLTQLASRVKGAWRPSGSSQCDALVLEQRVAVDSSRVASQAAMMIR